MREHPFLESFCGEDSKIPFCDLAKYTGALQEENRKERERRRSVGRRTRSKKYLEKKDGENELLLCYPFAADEATLADAACGLTELDGDLLGVKPPRDVEALVDDGAAHNCSDKAGGAGGGGRAHYVTIRQEDKDRLHPGQFLNDSLVDFWMRW